VSSGTVDLRDCPPSPSLEQLTAAMVKVSNALGVSWDAWVSGGRYVFHSANGDRYTSTSRDFRDAVRVATGLTVLR